MFSNWQQKDSHYDKLADCESMETKTSLDIICDGH